jgi:uncharacterized membrane protein
MINTNLILPHLILTFSSFFIGIYIFFLSSKKFEIIRIPSYIFSVLLTFAAITGLLLNTQDFTPFHVLSVVTIVTIPFAFYQLSKGSQFKYLGGLFYNFLGLSVALTGALEPHRTVGYRLWIKTLKLEPNFAENLFFVLLIAAAVNATIFVVLVNIKKFRLLK